MPDLFRVVGISAHRNEAELLQAAAGHGAGALALSGKTPSDPRITYSGGEGLLRMIAETDADIVVNGIAGAAGFLPSVTAVESGKALALANKETLVMAGGLVKALAAARGVPILPVDSEHSAVFQMFHKFGAAAVEAVILTASGGAFRDLPSDRLENVTPADALRHPTWSMGPKITIDSASLANKGLEVIEAHHLFDLPPERIKVLVHPQSYVHSLIETREGSLYAQIGRPDMRIPILNALTYPDPVSYAPGRFSLAGMSLTFREPDPAKFPMLPLAYEALRRGGSFPLVYNAANEEAVAAFLEGGISFPGIAETVSRVMDARDWPGFSSVSEVLRIDREARLAAADLLDRREGNAK
jgi:1-deoxy-D-xylulose-5-phosphate reductoisomerase